jgi:hypothetical protein
MTLDLTTLLVSVVTGFFGVLAIVIPAMISARMKDQQAAATLAAAVKNSLGAMEQAAKGVIVAANPAVTIPGVPASLQPGVQYVLTHAGDEAARFGITPVALADKINAAVGLQALAEKVPAVVAVVPALPSPALAL